MRRAVFFSIFWVRDACRHFSIVLSPNQVWSSWRFKPWLMCFTFSHSKEAIEVY